MLISRGVKFFRNHKMPRTDLKQKLFIDQYSTIAHSLGVRLLNFDCMMSDCNSFSVFFLSTGSTNVIPYSIDKSHCKSVFEKISSFFYPEPYSTLLIL